MCEHIGSVRKPGTEHHQQQRGQRGQIYCNSPDTHQLRSQPRSQPQTILRHTLCSTGSRRAHSIRRPAGSAQFSSCGSGSA
eukprot:9010751-Alexandrium_andersonii.AAC.1